MVYGFPAESQTTALSANEVPTLSYMHFSSTFQDFQGQNQDFPRQ